MRHPRLIDMAAAMTLGPAVYRCSPIVADGAVTTLTGIRGDNKSWFALAMSAAIHAGRELAGLDCRKGNALYLDGENGARVLGQRFTLLGLDPHAFYVADATGLHLPRDVKVIRELIAETNATFVVIDSLRRLAPGKDESSSNDMAPIYAELSALAQSVPCALLVIHHRSSKFGAPDSRGSSAIEDQSDLCFVLERLPNDPERKWRRRLRNTKDRIDAEPAPIWFEFKSIAGFMTVNSAEPFESSEGGAPSIVDGIADRLRDLASRVRQDGGWPPKRLADAVGRSQQDDSFRKALGMLVALDGWEAMGATRARVYCPPDSGDLGGPLGGSPDRPKADDPLERLWDVESDAEELPAEDSADRPNADDDGEAGET